MNSSAEINIEYVARLARLALTATEQAKLSQQLGDILHYVDKLKQVEVAGIEPMAHAVDVVQRLRPDVVTETDRRADFQAVAPETEAGLYLVPRVVE